MSTLLKTAKSIIPLFDRVLVQRLKPVTQTSSGIYIPEKNVEKLNQGTVISVGPGLTAQDGKLIAPAVKEGDLVLLPNFGGSPIKVGSSDEVSTYSHHHCESKIVSLTKHDIF